MRQLQNEFTSGPNCFNGSDTVYNIVGTGANQTFTIPSNAQYMIFNADGNIWVNFNGVAAAQPASNVTNGTGSVLNPSIIACAPIIASSGAAGVINIFAASGVHVSVSFFASPSRPTFTG